MVSLITKLKKKRGIFLDFSTEEAKLNDFANNYKANTTIKLWKFRMHTLI